MGLILRWVNGAFGPYILGALGAVIAILLICLAAQSVRLDAANGRYADLQKSIVNASRESEARGAKTGLEAVEGYVQQQQKDAPVIERVVTRTRNVCLRPSSNLPVPARTEDTHDAAAGAGNDEDRAFREAIANDLATCQNELTRFSALQQWVISNQGDTK